MHSGFAHAYLAPLLPFLMRLAALSLALLLLAPVASAQDATQDLRLRLISNDATDGGDLVFAIDARTDASRAPNTSLGSATIDVAYDSAHLTISGAGGAVDDADGYSVSFTAISCNGLGGDCLRIGITSSGIGTGVLDDPGFDVGTSYTELATLSFTLDATSAVSTSLLIDRSTLSVGYYDSQDNSADNGIIEDNTGAVGEDVIDFETVSDLSVRTATLNAGPNWYLVGMPGSGATLNDFASPFWTQGFSGADGGTNGSPNVVFWDETTGAYAAPGAQSDAVSAGAGFFFYVYADDDNDGSDDAFPKSVTVGANPVNDHGSPVNATDPNPYVPTLPFTFSTTYTDGSGAPAGDGWNLLSNPTDEDADWDDAGWTRTNVSTVLYTWTGTAYRTWTPGGVGGDRGHGILTPFEGFWAEAMAASPVLTMPAAAYDAVAPPSREAAVPAVRLHVAGEVNGQALADEAFVAFLDGSSAGRDIYDAHELVGFTDTQLHLFTELETGETFTTDVRPPLDKDGIEVPVDVAALASATRETTLTLTWPELRQLDASTPVQLLDLETETIIDLWTETEYTFSLRSTASRTAGQQASPDVLAMQGPQTLRTAVHRSARSANRGRFLLFIGSDALMPVSNVSEEEAVFELAAPAPNPTHSTTRLRYSLADAGEARVAVYDMLGRSVAIAASGLHAAGRHHVVLDTGDFAPGLYVVRLEADGQAATRSLTVVR